MRTSARSHFPLAPSSELPEVFHLMCRRMQEPTWLALIPRGRVVGSKPMVVGHDDTLFAELSNFCR